MNSDALQAFSQSQISHFRENTPGCLTRVHFNNASSALSPKIVNRAITEHLVLEQQLGPTEAAEIRSDEYSAFYLNAAKLIGAEPSEIAFTSGAGIAWNMMLESLNLTEGDEIVTHEDDYSANFLAYLCLSESRKIKVIVAKNSKSALVDLDDFESKISPKTKALLLTHVPMQTGIIQPAMDIGRIAKKHNIPYFLDAAHSLGQMPVDVNEIQCDAMVAPGRKFIRGPKGTGILYVSQKIQKSLTAPLPNLRSARWISKSSFKRVNDARLFETSERSTALQIGLSKAIEYTLKSNVKDIEKYISGLTDYLISGLNKLGARVINGDSKENRSSLVLFTMTRRSSEKIVELLRSKKINASVVIKDQALFSSTYSESTSMVRLSMHYYNTLTEINLLLEQLEEML